MKKLDFQESSQIKAGDFSARLAKQMYKCRNGSTRACKRMIRMQSRLL